MLWLIDVVGGAILLFVFGMKAWQSTSEAARWIRLATGSVSIGILLLILAHKYTNLLLAWVGSSKLVWLLIVLGLVGLTLVLELLRRRW